MKKRKTTRLPQPSYRDFESNLLSLLNHELRTPLTGVRNAVQLLEVASAPDEQTAALQMLRRNADQLEHHLKTLLDLSSMEVGHFRPRLREIDLATWLEPRISHLRKKGGVEIEVEPTRVLADPGLLLRAVELGAAMAGLSGGRARLHCRGTRWEWVFLKMSAELRAMVDAWKRVKAARAVSAMAQVLQSSTEFLNRRTEGLGVELLVLEEIFKTHWQDMGSKAGAGQAALRQAFTLEDDTHDLFLKMSLPAMNDPKTLERVVGSRMFEASQGMGAVALVALPVPKGLDGADFLNGVRSALFRVTDSAYFVAGSNAVALVLSDCREEDVPKLLARLDTALSTALGVKDLARKARWVLGPGAGPRRAMTPEQLLQALKLKA